MENFNYITTTNILIYLVVSLFLLFIFTPSTLFAISEEQRRLMQSGVHYYNLDDVTQTGDFCALPGADNAEQAWNFLRIKGLTAEQAAGVLGNLQAESNLNPRLVEGGFGFPSELDFIPPNIRPNGQPGYGIAQWTTPSRKDGLQTLADEKNLPVYDLALQLEYLYQETTNRTVNRGQPSAANLGSETDYVNPPNGTNEWEGLQMMESPEHAAIFWKWNFERPQTSDAHIQRVLTNARDFYNRFSSWGVSEGAGGCVSAIGDWQWPHGADNGRITSCFGSRRAPTAGASTNHPGVDIAAGEGTPILAAADGVVTFAGSAGNAGLLVKIEHSDGLETQYMHNSEILVSNGDTVEQGQQIAREGATGNVTGSHLHFEIIRNGEKVNPLDELLIPTGVTITGSNCTPQNTGGQI